LKKFINDMKQLVKWIPEVEVPSLTKGTKGVTAVSATTCRDLLAHLAHWHCEKHKQPMDWYGNFKTWTSEVYCRIKKYISEHEEEYECKKSSSVSVSNAFQKFEKKLYSIWKSGIEKVMEDAEREIHLSFLSADLLSGIDTVPKPVYNRTTHCYSDHCKHSVILWTLRHMAEERISGNLSVSYNSVRKKHFPHLPRSNFCEGGHAGWFSPRMLNHIMEMWGGFLPEENDSSSTQVRGEGSLDKFREKAMEWSTADHNYFANRQMHKWELKTRERYNTLGKARQAILEEVDFIPDLNVWSEEQAKIIQEKWSGMEDLHEKLSPMPYLPIPKKTRELLQEGAVICHASHLAPDQVNALCVFDFAMPTALTVGHFSVSWMLLKMV